MEQSIIHKVEDYVKENFSKRLPSEFTYHNFEHTIKVKEAVDLLSDRSNIGGDLKESLIIAALFHDLGICISLDNHEELSKQMANSYLQQQSYPVQKIRRVEEIIEATKMDHDPLNQLEGIIKDADLCGLGNKNYFEESNKLRHEWEHINGKNYEDLEWHRINYEFMKQHEYHTEEARALFSKQKEKNIHILREMIDEEKARKKSKEKKEHKLGVTISSSKSAQTQFKTALRNHIDLSAIADNKANIMLSVNALIITVALPIIANQVVKNHLLLTPALILLVVCVTSMIYATLATRPIKMKGIVSPEDIEAKKSNLFFFGNFYKMSLQNYVEGIDKVVSDPEILDNSIIRDLFYLGKALGAKYKNLRLCYNIFMFGMIAVVIAFTIAFFLTSINENVLLPGQ